MKMKRFISILLTVLLLVTIVPAQAIAGEAPLLVTNIGNATTLLADVTVADSSANKYAGCVDVSIKLRMDYSELAEADRLITMFAQLITVDSDVLSTVSKASKTRGQANLSAIKTEIDESVEGFVKGGSDWALISSLVPLIDDAEEEEDFSSFEFSSSLLTYKDNLLYVYVTGQNNDGLVNEDVTGVFEFVACHLYFRLQEGKTYIDARNAIHLTTPAELEAAGIPNSFTDASFISSKTELPGFLADNAIAFADEFYPKYDITFHRFADGGADDDVTIQVTEGKLPEAPEVAQYMVGDDLFTFTEWDRAIAAASENTTYTAQYSSVNLGHDWGDWVQTTDPTCTLQGEETRVCKRDATHIETRPVAALGHTPAEAVVENTIDPNCTDNGSYDSVVYCEVCKAELSRNNVPIEKLGHDFKGVVTDPTCTEQGFTTYTCTRCPESYVADFTDALGHALIPHAGKAATCLEIGWDAYDTCSRCDYTTYVEIPAQGHDYVHHDAKAPTCLEIGWEAYDTCSKCDYTTYVEIPAEGHDYIHHDAKAPTCLEIGWDAYDTCSRCDYTTYNELPALGHDLIHHDAKAATCLEIGWDAYDTCSRCDYTTYVEIPALGHDLIHHDFKAATCLEIGWDAYDTCSRCDYTTYNELPALGHDLIHHDAKAATCLEIGWDAYDTCSRCDYTTYNELPALGHDIIHHDAKAATCTAIGWDAYDTCSRCDYTTYVEIPAQGHDYVHHDAKAPTCLEIGWEAYDTCSKCDYTTYSELAALGHNLIHHDAKAATCTEIGWDAYDTCSRCDYTTYSEIAALGHNYVASVVVPTVRAGGYTLHQCSRCESNYKDTFTERVPLLYEVSAFADKNITLVFKNAETAFTVNAADGKYVINDLPEGTYSVFAKATNCVTKIVDTYTVQETDYTLAGAHLPLGDVNGDNVIDIVDISVILSDAHFGKLSPADLDGDGICSPKDLAILLKNDNYGAVGDTM